ncbi:MAG: formylglycine-generating enzyme family protein [Microscillaceae bacterium]|nr:formylglycine-generating enzyme family protein [Microscillaceae bacterium]
MPNTTQTDILIPNTSITIPMIWVEGGSFWMGDNQSKYDREKPAHQEELDGFWMGKYPLTQAQWRAVVEQANAQGLKHELDPEPAYFKSNQRPVEQVSWLDCMAWIALLNALLKDSEAKLKSFNLPSEAQWEYAARGGIHHQDGYTYSGSDDLHEVAWYYDNSHQQTKVVGLKKPNQLGIYDLSGNVWEWCLDEYDAEAYKKTPENCKNPLFLDRKVLNSREAVFDDKQRENTCVLRGGSWFYYGDSCRVAYRYLYSPVNRYSYFGCRLLAG